MAIPYRREKEVRLREMFSSDYQLITVLPSWQLTAASTYIGQELDDVLFSRYKDILIDPERYMSSLDSWVLSKKTELDSIYAALVKKYDPLSNYDMIEKEGSVSLEGEKTSTAKKYGTEQTSQTIPDTKSSRYTTSYDNAAEGRLEAYNTSEILPGTAPTLEGHNAQLTSVEQKDDSQGRRGTELIEKFSGDVIIQAPESELEGDKGSQRELTRKGNIGVTTSQQMLESELQLRIKYSFINIFCDMFSKEMTIGVYEL